MIALTPVALAAVVLSISASALANDTIPISFATSHQFDAPVVANQPLTVASTCFSSGERVSGMNKICYYDCIGGTVAITVSAVSLCPLTINR